MDHVTLSTPLLGVVCHPKARIWYSLRSTCMQNLTIRALAVPDIIGTPKM